MTTLEIPPTLVPYSGQELIEQSEALARELHAGQFYDREPIPDFGNIRRTYADGHLKPVAKLVEDWGFGPEYIATAWLHDSIEDVEGVTPELLMEHRMPLVVARSVQLLSKEKGVDYDVPENFYGYLGRIASDPHAAVVKTSDSLNNLGNTIMGYPRKAPAKRIKSLRRYLDTVSHLRERMPAIPNDNSDYLDMMDEYQELARHAIPRPRQEA